MAYEFVIGFLLATAIYQWLGKMHYRRLHRESAKALEGVRNKLLGMVASPLADSIRERLARPKDVLEDEVIE